MKERLISTLEIGISALALYGLSFLAFPRELKERVRREQGGVCAWCGQKTKKLTIHHIIPQAMGGSDIIENAIGLCRNCHNYWDRLAFEKHKFYDKKQ